MCGRRCEQLDTSSWFLKPSSVLALAMAVCAVDAFTLTSQAHEAASKSSDQALPESKRIAIVMRGETFRYIFRDKGGAHRKPCAEEAKQDQMSCAHSLLNQTIKPLEERGNTIDVFFTTTKAEHARFQTLHKAEEVSYEPICPLDNLILDAFHANSSRVVKFQSFSSTGQAATMAKCLNGFQEEYGGSAETIPEHFDHVMIVRTDMFWKMSIEEIQEKYHHDWNNVTVQRRCQVGAGEHVGGDLCVLDTMWMMPANLYPAFASVIGHDRCFDPALDPAGHGHACARPIMKAIAEAGHPDAFGWLEPEHIWARGRSPIVNLIGR